MAVHLVSVLAVALKARLQNLGVQYLAEQIVVRILQFLVRTQDFDVPGCCDGTCTSITKVPAHLNTSIYVTGPIFK